MIPNSHASFAFSLLALLAQSPAPAQLSAQGQLSAPTQGQSTGAPVRYQVKLDVQEKRWEVAMTIALPKAAPFDLWIPRWTGGAYHLADFAQYVTEMKATDASGKELHVTKHEPVVSWTIDPGAPTQVEIRYTAPMPPADGPLAPILALEGNAISSGRANFTPCSLLAFVPEMQSRPVEVELALPPGWKAATALDRRNDGVYTAPSYLRLEDSPVLMGRKLEVATFEAAGAQHEVAALGRTEEQTKELAETCKKIVESASRMMGGLPYRRYVFLFEFSTRNMMGGGGLEHSYSTLILLGPGSSETDHVISHEYFHLWNAERIHVEGLEHPDYTKPFTTGTIWLNEGGTEYVSGLLLVDAGIETQKQFFRTLARNSAQVHSQGMRDLMTKRPWTEVSKAFTNATMGDIIEIALAHYVKGSIVLFALDLEIRRASKGERGMPDVMRYLFENYAKKGRGYGEDELPSILSKVAGADMKPFYDKYIAGKEMVDLAKFVDVIGLRAEGDETSMEYKLVDVEKPTPEQLAMRKKLFAIAK